MIICLLGILTIGGLCILAFNCIVYAAPAFVGLGIGLWASDTGAGPIGAALAATAAAGVTAGVFQVAFGMARNLMVRAIIAAIFSAPAAFAAHHIVLALARYSIPSNTWCQIFALASGGVVALVAVRRLKVADFGNG